MFRQLRCALVMVVVYPWIMPGIGPARGVVPDSAHS
jgi:hypothetical protein